MTVSYNSDDDKTIVPNLSKQDIDDLLFENQEIVEFLAVLHFNGGSEGCIKSSCSCKY